MLEPPNIIPESPEVEPEFNKIYWSSTFKLATCNSVLEPSTVKSPETLRLLNVGESVEATDWS